MRAYELMVILDPSVDERTVAPSMEKLLAQVTEAGGSVEKIDVWGKRRLAYEILKNSEGIYVVINMTATPEVAQEVDRQLTLNETVLRTKLLRADSK
ncbi:30S ribosomal protein S6 [Actinomycetaceae bacterium WB03_NA08]|uniref:Small ribosomal subunit protein bS6 n=1 Tax=Scrofimicrobium canadense TaxID=2652290 RepID=A0A6N7W7I6_9ACTO|nr:30S ribosomal protein S6 [Scrofimicrobium canadense]MSS85351.1 30S ribosomal protein S6 [Scrofimicrobium canadense]